MGLSIAIGGSMAVITLAMSLSVFPMMIEDISDAGITNSEIFQIQQKFDKTSMAITSIDGEVGPTKFSVSLTNTGSEKLWDYADFDLLVTYDANVSGSKVRTTEQFEFNKTGSFLDLPLYSQIATPYQDVTNGSWQATPLYDKIDEEQRDDVDFILSPVFTEFTTNDVELNLTSINDPQNSGFHTVRYAYRTTGVLDTKGMLAYGEGGISNPTYRGWANSTDFRAPVSANSIDDEIISAVIKASPISTEKVLVTLDKLDVLHVQTWNGSAWISNWNTTVSMAKNPIRTFDVEYEDSSGDVLVVFGDNTGQLKYRERVAGVWDTSNQNAGSPLADEPNLVIAKARPTNNDIFVGVLTDSITLEALRWNGASNSWDSQINTTALPSVKDNWVFDLAYERNSGDLFLLWGDDSTNLQSREFTTGWQSESVAYSFLQDVEVVSAGYDRDPASDKIAVGIIRNDIFGFGAWNGTSWQTQPAVPVTGVDTAKVIGVDFENSTGKALFAFVQKANPISKQLSWRTWDAASGFSGVTLEPGEVNVIRNLQVYSDPLSDDIMVLYADQGGDLFHRKWNGTSFSSLVGALDIDLSSVVDQSYSFAWDKVTILQLKVELLQGTTVIAQWDEGNPWGVTSYVQRSRILSDAESDSISDYTDLRLRFKTADGQFEVSWANFIINADAGTPGVGFWVANSMDSEILDARVLNPKETLQIILQIQYPIYSNGQILVTAISDVGIVATNSTIISP